MSADFTTQWTLVNAPNCVKTWLEMWTLYLEGTSSIEPKLLQSLARAKDRDIAQFQLACIYKVMSDVLEIHTNEPLPILDHLKYIWGCFSGYKLEKTTKNLLQTQLNIAIDQSFYLGKALKDANSKTANSRTAALEREILACSEQILELTSTIQTERQSRTQQEEQARQQIATISLRARRLEGSNVLIEHTASSLIVQLEKANIKLSELRKRLEGSCCVVCLEAASCMLFRPCMHACVCETCSVRCNSCPKCRAAISAKQKIFL